VLFATTWGISAPQTSAKQPGACATQNSPATFPKAGHRAAGTPIALTAFCLAGIAVAQPEGSASHLDRTVQADRTVPTPSVAPIAAGVLAAGAGFRPNGRPGERRAISRIASLNPQPADATGGHRRGNGKYARC
jgi:hypothetical protein